MIHLISFGTPDFKPSLNLLTESAYKNGVDTVHIYSPGDLKQYDFYKTNKYILSQKRGAGFWLWKPFILHSTLQSARVGDYVLYSDAGIEIVSAITPLIKLADKYNSVFFREGGESLNNRYTKRDCFVINDADSPKFWTAPQVLASFHLHKVCPNTIDFVSRWLASCSNPYSLTDLENICNKENLPEYQDHRHDQSILSILVQKENLPLFRDPSQYGKKLMTKKEYSSSKYNVVINHHRRRRPTLVQLIKSKLHL